MLNSWWILAVSFTQISRFYCATFASDQKHTKNSLVATALGIELEMYLREQKILFAQLGSNMLKESQGN